ncbi:MAG: metallophosphoesterase [Nanoarchaeota archaeon]|nr:metallophosphoesterase [Nanoarchaeota archaeon]
MMKKYIIFSDLHGADITPIEEMFQSRKVDAGICLGDFDRVATAKQVEALQDYEMHVVPGNHDYSHINKVAINSGTMSRQSINSYSMWEEWENDEGARNYMENLLKNPTIELDISGNKTLAIHGGLGGNYQTEPSYLWNRIYSEQDYIDNFNKMKENDIKIMLRGHDHKPQFARIDPDSGFKEYDAAGHGYNMFNNRMHIVNPGAFFEGNYAIITTDMPDRENPTIEFCKL